MKKADKVVTYINDLRKYLFDYKVFETYDEMEYFFTMGGCYIFYRILRNKFGLPIAISGDRCHCGGYLRIGLAKKMFFDINGVRTNSTYNFQKADKDDINHIKSRFGFKNYPCEGFEEFFIDNIFHCFEENKEPNIGTLHCEDYRGC